MIASASVKENSAVESFLGYRVIQQDADSVRANDPLFHTTRIHGLAIFQLEQALQHVLLQPRERQLAQLLLAHPARGIAQRTRLQHRGMLDHDRFPGHEVAQREHTVVFPLARANLVHGLRRCTVRRGYRCGLVYELARRGRDHERTL